MKKTVAFLCAMLLAFSMPVIAFGEEVDSVSDGIETHDDVVGNLGGHLERLNTDLVYVCDKADLNWSGTPAGAITGMEMTIPGGNDPYAANGDLYVGYPSVAQVSAPYEVDVSKTVLSAVGFAISFSDPAHTPIAAPPGGGTMEYAYQANQSFVNNLAKKNGIEPSDIQLFIYEKERGGAVKKFVTAKSAADSATVGPTPLRAGTFVMALACDTSLLNKSQSRSDSSSETFVGIDPVDIPSVAAGEDESDLSPKTGQSLPAGTAPVALLVAGVLGGVAVIAARRWSVR